MTKMNSGHIFQINSTVIAGIFILFTLLGVAEYSNIKDTAEDDAKIFNELKIQNNTLVEYMNRLSDELKKSQDIQYENIIFDEIKSTKLGLLKIQSELEEREKVYSESNKIMHEIDDYNNDDMILSVIIKSIITLPFFVSLGWEILASFRNHKDDSAATGSKIAMFCGIILAVILLPILYTVGV